MINKVKPPQISSLPNMNVKPKFGSLKSQDVSFGGGGGGAAATTLGNSNYASSIAPMGGGGGQYQDPLDRGIH